MSKQTKRETKTTLQPKEAINRKWFLLDAEGKTLGRLASEITKILRGKHRVDFTPHVDLGDGVIVINADKVKVTGMKEVRKIYRYYTGHVGGLREVTFADMRAKKPTYMLLQAVKGMMPKTRLGKQQMRKLRLVAGTKHEHEAQLPIEVKI